MNKKNLSVVMAGAMLATSVAPVLADTTTEEVTAIKEYTVNNSNKGNLIKELRELLNSKVYANVEANDGTKLHPSGDAQEKYNYAGESVYCVQIGGNYYYKLDDSAQGITALETAIKGASNNTELLVYDRGHQEKNGKYYAFAQEDIEGNQDVFDEDSLKDEYAKASSYPAVYKMNYYNGVLTVYARKALNESEHFVLTFKAGSGKVDFSKPIDKDGEVVTDVTSSTIVGFAPIMKDGTKKGDKINKTDIAKITISDVDKEYTTVLSKLYDGLFLTEDGQKLIDALNEYDKEVDKGTANWVSSVGTVNTNANGIYSLEIKLEKTLNNKPYKQLITVTSNNEEQLTQFAKGLYRKKDTNNDEQVRRFPAQILAGDNRYETAVKVAKENADIKDVATNGNIVLVNGNSLVDGLAAAPLAASVWNMTVDGDEASKQRVAPILLTDSNGIPKATKDYMKEVIKKQQVGALDRVTVYLVGGEAVISKSVENDLKEIGFRVVRAGGEDREATSLAVANLIEKDGSTSVNRDEAFLVGANGEADAMSIASVAAATKTPIIVESVHGISEDTINYLKGYKTAGVGLESKDTTIIGGETVVSKATENKLTDSKISTDRIAGNNRQATNALVIDAYYGVGTGTVTKGHKFNNVVVSKDGINNKSELIDALTATSLAVKHNSPIVLGTNKLSNEQINVLELKADRTNGVYVYQVGIGVARDVVKTIAERIGLAK